MTVTYIFTGEEELDHEGIHIIPENATRLIIHESITIIPEYICYGHEHIVELICHDGVEKIEQKAFFKCLRLKRVIMLGVKVVAYGAFWECEVLDFVACKKLEIVEEDGFYACKSLPSINLKSVKMTDQSFANCNSLTHVEFSEELESVRGEAFANCPSLKRITIPLKHGLIASPYVFSSCPNLKRVDLVEREELQKFTAALHLWEWRSEMKEEIDTINDVLRHFHSDRFTCRTRVIRWWHQSVLDKVKHYQNEHQLILDGAVSTLAQTTLPSDIVMDSVLPYLELPVLKSNVFKERSRKRPRTAEV